LRTRESLEQEIHDARVLIEKRRIKNRRDRDKRFLGISDVSSYKKLRQSVLYLIFIIVYVWMVLK